MVIEKVTEESGVVMLSDFNYAYNTTKMYVFNGRNTPFYYSKKYVIDGEEFVLGSYQKRGKPDTLVHPMTGAVALRKEDMVKPTDSAILSQLIVKRSRTPFSTLRDVVNAFQNKRSGYKFELCQISLLM